MSSTFSVLGTPPPLIDLFWPIPTNAIAYQDGDLNVAWNNAILRGRGAFSGGPGQTTSMDPASMAGGFVGATGLRSLRYFAGTPMLGVDPGGGYLFGLPWLVPIGSLISAAYPMSMGAVIDLWFRGDVTAGEDGWSLIVWDYVSNATAANPSAATALGGLSLHRVGAVGANAFEARAWDAGGVQTDAVLFDVGNAAAAGFYARVELHRAPEAVSPPRITIDVNFPSQSANPIQRIADWRFASELPNLNTATAAAMAMCVHAPTTFVDTRGRVRSTGP